MLHANPSRFSYAKNFIRIAIAFVGKLVIQLHRFSVVCFKAIFSTSPVVLQNISRCFQMLKKTQYWTCQGLEGILRNLKDLRPPLEKSWHEKLQNGMSRAVVELYRDTVMEHQPRHGGGDKSMGKFS